jgi:pancreatic elastase II
MRSVLVFFAALSLCQARPQRFTDGARPSFMMGGEQYIVGGTNASPGEFPWQLSQQRQSGDTWSHSCGASMLSENYALSAAHCVDGAPADSLRVVAGLHQQSDLTGTQIVNLSGYQLHEDYLAGLNTNSNDIAILNFATPVVIGGNVQPATLPADNSNDYNGLTCVISGWGRSDTSDILPDTLQKASIEVITTDQCQALVDDVTGARIWENHICLYDLLNNIGACNGDSGGPLNCPDGVTRVAGITSWGVSSSLGYCLQTYPSVYTRTSPYLEWIAANTP